MSFANVKWIEIAHSIVHWRDFPAECHSFDFTELRIRGCIQKFPDWPSGARTASDTALCH
jgi:hypothetical protein